MIYTLSLGLCFCHVPCNGLYLPCNDLGLIKRFFPKGTDFGKVTEKELKIVQEKLNNRPRKILGYRTPNEVFKLELTNLNHKKMMIILGLVELERTRRMRVILFQ